MAINSVHQPTLPGIYFAPPKVRMHGLTETARWPWVSDGKLADGTMRLHRAHASEAWDFPELELHSTAAKTCIILDLDRPDHYHDLLDRTQIQRVAPSPNWVTHSATGRCHAVYTLRRPVLWEGPKVRRNPISVFVRVSEWLAEVLGADRGYIGPTAHNPIPTGHGPKRETAWLRESGWHLQSTVYAEGLADWIPKGWRVPALPERRTDSGRNRGLFDEAIKWASHTLADGGACPPVLDHIRDLNAALCDPPLLERELVGIARSVERYRARWKVGDHTMRFRRSQAARGRKSGEARRRKTSERNETILAMLAEGHSQAAVARHFGVSQQTVSYVVKQAAAEGITNEPNKMIKGDWGEGGDVYVCPAARAKPDPATQTGRGGGRGFTRGEPSRNSARNPDELENRLRNRASAALAAWSRERSPADAPQATAAAKPVPGPPTPDDEALVAAVARKRKQEGLQ